MQQTALDQWMRRKFLFITRIYCNTLPDGLPEELEIEEAGEESGGRFRYKMTTRDEDVIEEAVECFRMQNVTYTSRVYDRDVWFAKYLNDRNKSLTFRMVWVLMGMAVAGFTFSGLPMKIYNYVMGEEVEEVVDPNVTTEDIRISTVGSTVLEIDRQR